MSTPRHIFAILEQGQGRKTMHAVTSQAASILDQLIRGLPESGVRSLGEPRATLSVLNLETDNLVIVERDPMHHGTGAIEFWWSGGHYFPIASETSEAGRCDVVELGNVGRPVRVDEHRQYYLASFASMWLYNVRQQHSAWFRAQVS